MKVGTPVGVLDRRGKQIRIGDRLAIYSPYPKLKDYKRGALNRERITVWYKHSERVVRWVATNRKVGVNIGNTPKRYEIIG